MSIVAGVDFGTLSVRVSIFDSVKGRLGAGSAAYPLHRKQEDPDHVLPPSPLANLSRSRRYGWRLRAGPARGPDRAGPWSHGRVRSQAVTS